MANSTIDYDYLASLQSIPGDLKAPDKNQTYVAADGKREIIRGNISFSFWEELDMHRSNGPAWMTDHGTEFWLYGWPGPLA